MSVKLLLKSLQTIDIPQSTYEGIQSTRMVSVEQGWNLRFCMCVGGKKYWFQSVISFITIEHKKDIESSTGSSEEQKSFFFCWTCIHGYSTYATTLMTCQVEFQLTTIIHQKTNTPGWPHKKHTSQQKHNTTTLLKGIVLTMARTPAKGSTPLSSTPPKRNKQEGNNDVSNKQKCKKPNNNAKS